MNRKIRRTIAREKRIIQRRLEDAVKVNDGGPVLSATNIHYELADKTKAIAHGGIGAVHRLVNKLERSEQASEFDAMALTGVLSTQVVYDRFVRNFRSESSTSVRLDILVDRRTTGKENEE